MPTAHRAGGRTVIGVLVLVLWALVIGAACGTAEAESERPDTGATTLEPGPQISAVGPGLSVREALDSRLNQPLLVNGFVVARDGFTRLCSTLAESYPPQCGGDSLVLEGLDLASLDELDTAQGVTWSNETRQVLGRVSNGVLTVSGRSSA